MIRGINKRVIEINDIGSEYFEKAFLIIKDNKASVPNLEKEADRVMQTYFPRVNSAVSSGYLRTRSQKSRRLLAVLSVIAGIALVGVILALIL